MTEACAFAWAALRELGTPRFCEDEGAPDIHLETGRWIEVKSVHNSDDEHKRMEQMLEGQFNSGHVSMPPIGFYKKFCDSFMDSLKKFDRQNRQEGIPNVVFFNLNSLDTPQLANEESVNTMLRMVAEEFEKLYPKVKVVMCYSYNWKSPFRDPFAGA